MVQGSSPVAVAYSTSICPFESGKCGKEEEKYKNVNIWRTKRAY